MLKWHFFSIDLISCNPPSGWPENPWSLWALTVVTFWPQKKTWRTGKTELSTMAKFIYYFSVVTHLKAMTLTFLSMDWMASLGETAANINLIYIFSTWAYKNSALALDDWRDRKIWRHGSWGFLVKSARINLGVWSFPTWDQSDTVSFAYYLFQWSLYIPSVGTIVKHLDLYQFYCKILGM